MAMMSSPIYSLLKGDVNTLNIKLDFKIDPKKGQEELAKFGYYFNENGECRSLKKNKPVKQFATQRQYEAFGEATTRFVFYILRNHYKMTEIEIQNDINQFHDHKDHHHDKQNYAHTNIRSAKIFLSPKYGKQETLLLLMPITGAVKTGMWSRSACINDSLAVGTMYPFISECYRRNWAVILLDSSDTKLACSLQHVLQVYDEYIEMYLAKPDCTIKNVHIMCHGDGSRSAIKLIRERSQYLHSKLRAICMCCGVLNEYDMNNIDDFTRNKMMNWVASAEKLGTDLHIDSLLTNTVSSGHISPFYGPSNAMADIFVFFERQMKMQLHVKHESDSEWNDVATNKGIGLLGYVDSWEEKGEHKSDVEEEENGCKVRFRRWICNTVKLPQYLSCFVKNGYDDIRLIEFFDEDTIQNEIGIEKNLHRKLILKKANEFKKLQVEFDAILRRNAVLKEYKQELEESGILTLKQLKKGVQNKEYLGKILGINNENEINVVWNTIQSVKHPANAEEGVPTSHHI